MQLASLLSGDLFNTPVTLAAANLPAGATASFAPATVTPSIAPQATTFTAAIPRWLPQIISPNPPGQETGRRSKASPLPLSSSPPGLHGRAALCAAAQGAVGLPAGAGFALALSRCGAGNGFEVPS